MGWVPSDAMADPPPRPRGCACRPNEWPGACPGRDRCPMEARDDEEDDAC
jgi:hypothetical protein